MFVAENSSLDRSKILQVEKVLNKTTHHPKWKLIGHICSAARWRLVFAFHYFAAFEKVVK